MAFPSITWREFIERLRIIGVRIEQTTGGRTMVVREDEGEVFMHAPPGNMDLPVTAGVFMGFCRALDLDPERVLQMLRGEGPQEG